MRVQLFIGLNVASADRLPDYFNEIKGKAESRPLEEIGDHAAGQQFDGLVFQKSVVYIRAGAIKGTDR